MKKFQKVLTILLSALIIITPCGANVVARATKYHPGHHCGWVTADGSRISNKQLNDGKIRWVALSPDLIKIFPLGSKIRVESDNPYLNGIWEVRDKMAPWVRNGIDFLMPRKSSYFNNPCKVKIYKV